LCQPRGASVCWYIGQLLEPLYGHCTPPNPVGRRTTIKPHTLGPTTTTIKPHTHLTAINPHTCHLPCTPEGGRGAEKLGLTVSGVATCVATCVASNDTCVGTHVATACTDACGNTCVPTPSTDPCALMFSAARASGAGFKGFGFLNALSLPC
jgi:hypothetical protein